MSTCAATLKHATYEPLSNFAFSFNSRRAGAWIERLNHATYEALSNFAFNVNVRRYSAARDVPGWIVLDPIRLRQILYNLLSNAVKFSRPNSCVTLHVGVRRGAGGVRPGIIHVVWCE